MNRRGFLMGTGAAVAAPPMGALGQGSDQTQIVSIILTDVGLGTSAPHLLAVLDGFASRGLPVTCLVDPDVGSHQVSATGQTVTQVLAGATLAGPGLQLAAVVPELSLHSGYFQARHLRDAWQQITQVLQDGQVLPTMVAACRPTTTRRAPSGVRSAGTTLLLEIPERDAPVQSEVWPDGIVRLFGGRWLNLARYSGAELAAMSRRTQEMIFISASDWNAITPDALAERAGALADDLGVLERGGRHAIQPVSDLQLRDSYAFSRKVAVHIERPMAGSDAAQTGFEAFLTDLASLGIVPSVGSLTAPFRPDRAADYWVPLSQETATLRGPLDLTEVTRQERAGWVTPIEYQDAPLSEGHSVALAEIGRDRQGFDAYGVLWLPTADIADPDAASDPFSSVDPIQDVVLSVRPDALVPAFARRALLNKLQAQVSDGVTEFVSLQEFVASRSPKDPEVSRQRRTVAASERNRLRPGAPDDAARREFLKDARIAWQYFEDNTNATTGLCPATVNFSPTDGWKHPTVTMWDVGSHINALAAARQLGLIEQSRFDDNLALILRQIRGRKSQGRMLPQGWLRVDRHKWGNDDFDGSDAGRLLSSLSALRRFTGRMDQLQTLVESWDLDQIVIGGEVHSVTEGRLKSVYRSHSAHYSARAFRLWGIDARSPYEGANPFATYDDQVALLERVTWIGPLGAEPLLLEGLEQGFSAESAYLADVLFGAQVEHHDETGRLVAVSEGPIDVSPWFTYQGLQLDAAERTWALDTVGFEPQYADPTFWRDNLVISSKAAFLWAALRPHAYSDALLTHVRTKARTHRGYASSTFSRSGRVTETYTDLNTNAVILQSVAHALGASAH